VTHVRVAEIGANHVTLVWQSPDGDSAVIYEVSYWTDDLQRNTSVAYSFHANITLRDLRQQAVYMFRVSRLSAQLATAITELVV